MIESLAIRNFRCFSDLKIRDLKRVNLFSGKNNAGKTALLESIYLQLGPGNPALSVFVNAFRGIESFKKDPDDIWGWLFSGSDSPPFCGPVRMRGWHGCCWAARARRP